MNDVTSVLSDHSRFMESEMELNDALQEMKNVATVPSLYPVQWTTRQEA